MKMTIGANIKRLRMEKSATQEQLSVAMNVTCAAVSKWERGDTYPDITLLQPLAYYFGVTLDELMGYDQEKIAADIDEVLALYHQHWNDSMGQEIITKAYRDYPNDYRIMHSYMWNIAGDRADNDPAVLLAHKDELGSICDKILEGCTDDNLRLGAWNMKAKLLHAEGKTEEACEIYRAKFKGWFDTCGQMTEQLFAKDTKEYYFHLQKNLYELADFAADKLGRSMFFDPSLTLAEKTERASRYGDILLNAHEQTGDDFFLLLAESFLGRMENDLCFRGGTDAEIIAVMEKHLHTVKLLAEHMEENVPLHHAYSDHRPYVLQDGLLRWNLNYRTNATSGRRAELLQNPGYTAVLEQYHLINS